jgi:hypothetical protein
MKPPLLLPSLSLPPSFCDLCCPEWGENSPLRLLKNPELPDGAELTDVLSLSLLGGVVVVTAPGTDDMLEESWW